MKILCVIDNLGPGGAQRQIVELALGFKERGNEVHFLTYHNNPFYNSYLEKAGIINKCIKEPNYLKRLFRMRYIIRHGNFDIVLSFLEGANIICELAGFPFRKWKLIVGERFADPHILKSPKLRIYRWFHLLSDYVVCNSYNNKELVHSACRLLSRLKVKVIYNIVDFSRWKPSSDFVFRREAKLKLVISASHIYRKNLNGLINAVSLLSEKELENIEIDWYGDHITEPYYDNSFPEAKQKICFKKLESIISFYPATNEITQKIQNADAIGLFSFLEGFPNTVCEGMACAKPIICSNISDIPGILSFDKNLLFDPSDSISIKQAMTYLISLSKDQLYQIGFNNEIIVKEKFDKERNVSSYLELFSA
jgi:glycosyltransferase involved in cell wall biosynthesis